MGLRLHIVSFVTKSTFSTRKKIIKIYHVKFEVSRLQGFFRFYVMRKSRKKKCLVLVIRFSGFRITLSPFSFQF